jgi:ketosteroid isomerase-like protein
VLCRARPSSAVSVEKADRENAATEFLMKHKISSTRNEIAQVIQQLNEFWLNKQYDKIAGLVAEDVIVAPPGFDRRIQGRKAYVQSYRDYDQAAITRKFSAAEPQIDISGSSAVAVYTFAIVYDMAGRTHREKGRELLVLSRASGGWQVVWRTMFVESAD